MKTSVAKDRCQRRRERFCSLEEHRGLAHLGRRRGYSSTFPEYTTIASDANDR